MRALDSRILTSTFCGWIDRKLFARDLLPRLEPVLGWSVSERQATQLGVRLLDRKLPDDDLAPATLTDVLRKINKRYHSLQNALGGYASLTQRLLECLAKGTLFIYTASTVSPLEFLDPEHDGALAKAIAATQRSMAQAVLNGCLCLYVRPSEKVTEYYKAWRYGQLLEREEVVGGMAAFEAFTIRTAMERGGPHGRLTEPQARQWVRRHLLQCMVDKCPMWMPGFALALLGWVAHQEVRTAITLSLPGRHFGGILTYPPYYQLPFRYLGFCRSLCEQALAILAPPPRGEDAPSFPQQTLVKVEIDSAHRSPAEALAFFRSLHRLLRAARIAEAP